MIALGRCITKNLPIVTILKSVYIHLKLFDLGTGPSLVRDGGFQGWCIVATVDGYSELSGIGETVRIGNGVGKTIGNLLTGGPQCLNGSIVIVDDIGIATIGIQGQTAVTAVQSSTYSAGDTRSRVFRTGANGRDGFGVSRGIHIGVVGQHIVCGVATRRGIGNASLLNGHGGVIHANRIVVVAMDGDGQLGGVGEIARILDEISERFAELLIGTTESLNDSIGFINGIDITAVGVKG
ncbi:MAG: hypothetical protein HW380_3444 [Magnetococcales bacterium]|nr:hypothetical protein [Magnetococcales bacterium]